MQCTKLTEGADGPLRPLPSLHPSLISALSKLSLLTAFETRPMARWQNARVVVFRWPHPRQETSNHVGGLMHIYLAKSDASLRCLAEIWLSRALQKSNPSRKGKFRTRNQSVAGPPMRCFLPATNLAIGVGVRRSGGSTPTLALPATPPNLVCFTCRGVKKRKQAEKEEGGPSISNIPNGWRGCQLFFCCLLSPWAEERRDRMRSGAGRCRAFRQGSRPGTAQTNTDWSPEPNWAGIWDEIRAGESGRLRLVRARR